MSVWLTEYVANRILQVCHSITVYGTVYTVYTE